MIAHTPAAVVPQAQPVMPDAHDLAVLIDSHYPLVYIESHEEERVIDLCQRVGRKLGLPLFTWSVTEGLHRREAGYSPMLSTREPSQVLEHIGASRLEAIYLLRDFHPYLEEPRLVRRLREIALGYEQRRRAIVIVSPKKVVPEELAAQITLFDLAMPDEMRLRLIIEREIDGYRARHDRP
ncbi:MAG TPA: ATPase, partial [Acidimicrobiia bacterium]